MARYLVATKGRLAEPVTDQLAECLREGKQGFWLDIENPDDADFALLEHTFKFHQLTLEDIRHQNQRPKVEEYTGYAFVVLFTAELEGSRVQIREHHLYLSSQYLVSVHIEPSDPLDRLRERIKANPDLAKRSLPYLFYLVVDQLVDALFPVLEKLDEATDAVEDGIILRPDTAALTELSDLKRAVVDLRKVLGAQRDVFQRLTTRRLAARPAEHGHGRVPLDCVEPAEPADHAADGLRHPLLAADLPDRVFRDELCLVGGAYRAGLDLLAAGGRRHGPDDARPALLLPPPRLDLARGQVDDAAGDVRVLVEVVAGANPMVSVGNRQGNLGRSNLTPNQEHRG